MIEPFKAGAALRAEIEATCPHAGTVAVWWLGQSGFLLKSAGVSVVIDPYLSEHLTQKYQQTDRPHVRMTRAPLRGGDLTGVDLVLVTHRHSDHLDPATIPALLEASPAALVVLPESLLDDARRLGLPADRLRGMVAGAVLTDRGVTVRALPSAHEGLDTDARGRHLYLGYVLDLGGLRFYHGGDTLVYDGLAALVGPGVDVAFLPINGRDPARGVPGNMTAAEAVDLANQIGPRWVVPHHYDMFTFNTVPVGAFEAEACRLDRGVVSRVLRCGELWEVRR